MNSKLAGHCADDERNINQAIHRPRKSIDLKDSPGIKTNTTLQIKQNKRKGKNTKNKS